jgi:hypothetical protein
VIEVVGPLLGATSLQKRNATATVTAGAAASKAGLPAGGGSLKAERETIKLSMSVVGDPLLAAKMVVEVRGISSLLSGKSRVTEAKHSIGSKGDVVDLKLTPTIRASSAAKGTPSSPRRVTSTLRRRIQRGRR